jgi:hypothetical protein
MKVSRILGKAQAVELATIPEIDKELNGAAQGMNAAGKAPQATSEARQVVP